MLFHFLVGTRNATTFDYGANLTLTLQNITDPCSIHPCQNASSCTAFVNMSRVDYICNCTEGFSGKNCSHYGKTLFGISLDLDILLYSLSKIQLHSNSISFHSSIHSPNHSFIQSFILSFFLPSSIYYFICCHFSSGFEFWEFVPSKEMHKYKNGNILICKIVLVLKIIKLRRLKALLRKEYLKSKKQLANATFYGSKTTKLRISKEIIHDI